MTVDDADCLVLFCQQQKQREFYVARESRSGRQLLESAGDDDAAKLICNITDTMFFYAENITIIMDDNEIAPQDWQCDIEDCTDNSTVYVNLAL